MATDEEMAKKCADAFRPMADAARKVLDSMPTEESLRDRFAGQAMAAYIVSNGINANIVPGQASAIACNAYRIADAMMAEREAL
jgi:hypothetical protein